MEGQGKNSKALGRHQAFYPLAGIMLQGIGVFNFQFGKEIFAFTPWDGLSAFRPRLPGLPWNSLSCNKFMLQKPESFQEVFLKVITSFAQLVLTKVQKTPKRGRL